MKYATDRRGCNRGMTGPDSRGLGSHERNRITYLVIRLIGQKKFSVARAKPLIISKKTNREKKCEKRGKTQKNNENHEKL